MHTKKIIIVFVSILCCFLQQGYAQTGSNWTAIQKAPAVFIQNQGQYDQYSSGQSPVLYGIDHGFGWRVLFGQDRAEYIMQAIPQPGSILKTTITQEWLNTDSSAAITAGDIQDDYYSYSYYSIDKYVNADRIHAYGKLYRRNIYPGIHLEYSVPEAGGVKYLLQLDAGADISRALIRYSGAPVSMDQYGNIKMPVVSGELIDHAPKAWYADNVNEVIPCSFNLNGNVVGFTLGAYDHNRAVIVDPWTVNPALPAPFNRSFEVDSDIAGNVWVFGGGMGFNLKKYNAAGTLQWTHVTPWDTSNAEFGELLITGAGDAFITSGSPAKIRRLTTAGATTFTNNGPFTNNDAYYGLALSCDSSKLFAIGSRFVSSIPQGYLFNVNLANGNQLAGSPYNVRPVNNMVLYGAAISGSGNIYALANDNLVAINKANNIIYSVSTGYTYPFNSPGFKAKNIQGLNCIDVNDTYVYINHGNSLEKRDRSTGAFLNSIAIPGGGFTSGIGGTGPSNSGIVVDACGNVFVGSTNAVYKYDANFNLLGSVATTGTVYDLKIAAAGTLLIGGAAFLTSNTSLAPCARHTIVCSSLPVKLGNFTGQAKVKQNELKWTTTLENNSSHFILERSYDALLFEPVTQVGAAGYSDIRINYTATDNRPYALTYYRLKQVDLDGTYEYSNVISVRNDAGALQLRSVAPNPARGSFVLELFSEKLRIANVQVFNTAGKPVYNTSVNVAGKMQHAINCDGWAAGVYFIKLTDKGDGKMSYEKVIVE